MNSFLKKGISSAGKEKIQASTDLEKEYRSLEQGRLFKKSRLKLVILITTIVMGIEVAGGLLTNSLALLSDAGHMLTHMTA